MAINWTADQKKVIETKNRNILVSAAAGSGKTTVLSERVVQRITDPENSVDVDRILVLTFTRAAAREMKAKITKNLTALAGKNPGDENLRRQLTLIHKAEITTIDSFCISIYKNYFEDICADPKKKIVTDDELAIIRDSVMDDLLEKKYEDGDEAFLNLTALFAKSDLFSGLKDTVYSIVKAASASPWPMEFFDSLLRPYEINTKNDLTNSWYIDFVMNYTDEVVRDIVEKYEYERKLIAEDDGYFDHFDKECPLIAAILNEDTYEGKRAAVNNLFMPTDDGSCNTKFKALGRKKSKNNAPSFDRSHAKSERDSAKAILKDLNEKFFKYPSEDILKIFNLASPHAKALISLTKEFYINYQNEKEKERVMDFSDAEHMALSILVDEKTKERRSAAIELSQYFEEIMVDEYQDSNDLQEAILKSVAREDDEHGNYFCVGDVKQSIYGFRNANPKLFLEKYRTYDKENGRDRLILLKQNFRSRSEVTDTVNHIFAEIMKADVGGLSYGEDESLNFAADFDEPDTAMKPEIHILKAVDYDDNDAIKSIPAATARKYEAEMAVRTIENLMQNIYIRDSATGVKRHPGYGDIAILSRTLSTEMGVIAATLEKHHIPHVLAEEAEFFETVEIRPVVSLLKLIGNRRDDIAVASVLKSPFYNVSDNTLLKIRHEFMYSSSDDSVRENDSYEDANSGTENNNANNELTKDSVAIAEVSSDDKNSENKKQRIPFYTAVRLYAEKHPENDELSSFFSDLRRYRRDAREMSIKNLITEIYDTGYLDIMTAYPGGEDRRANLLSFLDLAAEYEKDNFKGLYRFNKYIALRKKYGVSANPEAFAGKNEVTVMTIHKSKGLEFPVVILFEAAKDFRKDGGENGILIDRENGLYVDAFDSEKRISEKTFFRNVDAEKQHLEKIAEEQRLLYVAMTRAKEKLIITGSLKTTIEESKGISDIADLDVLAKYRNAFPMTTGYRFKADNYFDFILPIAISNEYKDDFDEIHLHTVDEFAEDETGAGYMESFNANDAGTGLKASASAKNAGTGLKSSANAKNAGEFMDASSESTVGAAHAGHLSDTVKAPGGYELFLYDLKDYDKNGDKEFQHEIENRLSFSYPFSDEVSYKTKYSVTEIRDAYTREEFAETENIYDKKAALSNFRPTVPEFLQEKHALTGNKRGTAVHRFMECFDFARDDFRDIYESELNRMTEHSMLSEEAALSLSRDEIEGFLKNSLAERMHLAAKENHLFREKAFMAKENISELLKHKDKDDAIQAAKTAMNGILTSKNTSDKSTVKQEVHATNEVMVQGIIDAFFIEGDHIVLLDYKTDKTNSPAKLKEEYFKQLDIYRNVLSRALKLPVTEMMLYSFTIGSEIPLM